MNPSSLITTARASTVLGLGCSKSATVMSIRSSSALNILSSSFTTKSSVHTTHRKSGVPFAGILQYSTTKAPKLDAKKTEPPSFVFKTPETKEVGPGAGKDKEYKNPEYFSYHTMSYADMDIVMAKLRCPQPSSVKK